MKALLLEKAMLAVGPGSIVEISEGQFKALGDKAVAYKEEAKEVEEIKEEPEEEPKEEPVKGPKKAPTSKKTSSKSKK